MIKLELTLNEVNIVLATLAKHPFDVVASLITKIQAQATPQLQPSDAASEPLKE